MKRTLVIDVVGLTRRQLGPHTPHLSALAEQGFAAPIEPALPAVTCTAQATYLTGTPPSQHGIVANGWYWRDRAEVNFWRQSNHLIQRPKLWDTARQRDAAFTCAQMFWWFNMFADVEHSVTPRPGYLVDGRKVPDCYSHPPQLRRQLHDRLGTFPLFHFWGPGADITSTRWITSASLHVLETHTPTLTLVYLPHLDYEHQRSGPDSPASLRALTDVDAQVGRLLDHARAHDLEVLVLSEYGIEDVHTPVHLNRVLRQHGYLEPWLNLDQWELLEPGACRAVAVADHQLAHVYVRDPKDVPQVQTLLERTPGVARVLAGADREQLGLDHPRSGELVCLAEPGHWFTYYYWLDDQLAPDFARTVEIHKKPGFDPCELFLDPHRPLIKVQLAWRLLRKLLGFRYVMDVIPLDASLVRGSHGRPPSDPERGPVLISASPHGARDSFPATAIHDLILDRIFGA